jgi:hypothetical protein
MREAIHSIIVAFSEILKWKSIKLALISGIIVTALWSFIGYSLWDNIMLLSSKIIEYIPFSMIRSNGATMLSVFLWFQLVLITFALIYAFFGNFILRALSKEKYSSFTFITIAISAVFWGIVWFFAGDYIYNQFLKLLTWLPFETLQKGLAFIVGVYIIYTAIIITLLFITSIFSEPILKMIEENYFESSNIRKGNMFKSIGYTIKDSIIFLILSTLLFPLLFVPGVNLIVQLMLWSWLVKDTISFDALSLVDKNLDKTFIKEHRVGIYTISLATVLFYLVPILNIFGAIFGEIAMYHYFRSLKEHNK